MAILGSWFRLRLRKHDNLESRGFSQKEAINQTETSISTSTHKSSLTPFAHVPERARSFRTGTRIHMGNLDGEDAQTDGASSVALLFWRRSGWHFGNEQLPLRAYLSSPLIFPPAKKGLHLFSTSAF